MIELRDAIDGLLSLDKGSVDLILSDLPSGETAAEFDRKPNLRMLWHAVWHALKPTGICCFMASSFAFAGELSRSTPYYRYDMIWHKTLAGGFLNAHSRPLRNHEFILLFWQQEGTYVPQMREGFDPITSYANKHLSENYSTAPSDRPSQSRAGATDRYPVSVLSFPSVPTRAENRSHPQQKPESLLRHLICSYSEPGDLVVDPYAGSGSTLRAAFQESRRARGFDTSPRFAPRELPQESPIP
jgi:site-specific DNA-methyltransferase (adenine-specific)